jgi:NADH:ubiquinone oxidoreductase subunit H
VATCVKANYVGKPNKMTLSGLNLVISLTLVCSASIIKSNFIITSESFNLSNIVLAQENGWFILPLFPMFIVFCVSMLAETNRHPFDLPEAEAELVSGYNVVGKVVMEKETPE